MGGEGKEQILGIKGWEDPSIKNFVILKCLTGKKKKEPILIFIVISLYSQEL